MPSMPALPHSRASTTLPPAPAGSIGVPEASSGTPSPPQSPPLAAISNYAATTKNRPTSVAAARRGGAAYTITEECERLFCETLRTVFLVEGNTAVQDSLVTGMHYSNGQDSVHCRVDSVHSAFGGDGTNAVDLGSQIKLAPDDCMENSGLVHCWVEMWDYVGGARFRGVVVEKGDERAMLVFFDQEAVVQDLKPGLMALLELCSVSTFSCSDLIVCLDRTMPPNDLQALTHDLGWVGFEATTLADWTKSDDIISDKWIFLGMEM